MFNLNKSNRIMMSQYPSDMRIGINGMCGKVRSVGLDPCSGNLYLYLLTDNSNQEEIQQPFLSITKKLASRHLRVFL